MVIAAHASGCSAFGLMSLPFENLGFVKIFGFFGRSLYFLPDTRAAFGAFVNIRLFLFKDMLTSRTFDSDIAHIPSCSVRRAYSAPCICN